MNVLEFATFVTELTGFTNKVLADRSRPRRHAWRGRHGALRRHLSRLAGLGKKDGRKVLVLVSDGGDTVKGTTYDEALEQALRNEVMIYSIIDVPIEASAGRDLGGEHALITLSEQTGGKHFYVDAGGLDKAFAQVSDDLRTQYMIGYYPHNQEPGRPFHRIDVTIPRATAEAFNIRHKTGYYAEPQKARD